LIQGWESTLSDDEKSGETAEPGVYSTHPSRDEAARRMGHPAISRLFDIDFFCNA